LFLFVITFIIATIFPRYAIKPAVANDIPTLIQDYYGYPVVVPDWTQITWSNLLRSILYLTGVNLSFPNSQD
ncbi:MAG: hypothetical protein AB4038_03435, partial [Prochloraceae cyanobacterium]